MMKDEILNMPAGREIEALIAVEIFGWQWLPWSGNTEQKVLVQYPEQAESMDWWGKDVMDLVPGYSTDIAAAWDVVYKLHNVAINRHHVFWFCSFKGNESAQGETAPLAICRAALLAVVGATI